uniref:Uncharacterized protein n=1 Tax=Medicago truncatula TaxID=3880 RepID=Q2HTI7_MEDTR|nr:hypothetical protein MtrDRAFT_AC150441g2v1 [Medicago truncatula]
MGNIGCYLLTQNNLVHYGSLRRPFVNAKCPGLDALELCTQHDGALAQIAMGA